MFKFFRAIVLLLTLATAILSIFALTGSYRNASYLTKTYTIDFHLERLDLSRLLRATTSKRSFTETEKRAGEWNPTTTPSMATYTSTSSAGALINQIVDDYTYSALGLSDVYSVGFWGYCKGDADNGNIRSSSGEDVRAFNDRHVNFTYCSKPTPGFTFDPLEIFKTEVKAGLDDSSSGLNSIVENFIDDLTYDNFDLPGDIHKNLKLYNKLIQASFGLIVTVAVLSSLGVIIQFLAFCFSPNNCCLSFLNTLYQMAISVLLLVGGAIVTAINLLIRRRVNDYTDEYGIRSYVSVQFYAFLWSAFVASLLVVGFSLLGHCLGLFGTGRRKFKSMVEEPAMAYAHEAASVFTHGSDGGSEVYSKAGSHGGSHHS